MISVELVIQELLRVEGEIPDCIARCGQCAGGARSAAGTLGPFGRAAGGAQACLSVAADRLASAGAGLEQLRAGVRDAVQQLSK